MTVVVKGDLSKLEGLSKFFEKASKTQVKVHITDPKVAAYANYLEWGWVQAVTPKQRNWFGVQGFHLKEGSMLVNPPRPFFYGTVEANRDRWLKKMRQNSEALFKRSGYDMTALNKALLACGMMAAQDIRETVLTGKITNGEKLERRSELTLAMYAGAAEKGGHKMNKTPNQTTTDKPMYKTGHLAASIGYDLVTK